jgi:hypothetical protein
MKIGRLNYSNEEVAELSRAAVFGLLAGIPAGIAINILTRFWSFPNQWNADFFAWFFTIASFLGEAIVFWWGLSSVLALLFYRRSQNELSWHEALRLLLAMMLIPFGILYVALIYSFVIIPFYLLLLPFLPSFLLRALGYLLFLPFVYLFIVVLLPESKAGKDIRRLSRRTRKKQN